MTRKQSKSIDLTEGEITKKLLLFALPFILGDLMQQLYNITDTFVVGRYAGDTALAAVGSSYTLMSFLTSIILGLCMGSGVYFSLQYGKKNPDSLRNGIFISFVLISLITAILNIAVFIFEDGIIEFMNVPSDVSPEMKIYLNVIFSSIAATFIYNCFSSLLRSVGKSGVPIVFLSVSVIINVILDFVTVAIMGMGVYGAAVSTATAQYISAFGIAAYTFIVMKEYRIQRKDMKWNRAALKSIFNLSFFTCLQQSVMNFGILMVQGLVNSFGTSVMAAFSVAVKIDTLAYMPVQDYGNAFSTFIAQNHGAEKKDRITEGIKKSLVFIFIFCVIISSIVYILSPELMGIFTEKSDVIEIGTGYLRIEGACYIGIGILFMLYGYYRAIEKPIISVVLTIASLGTRVVLAYILSATSLGVIGIWLSIPIGWGLADSTGVIIYLLNPKYRS